MNRTVSDESSGSSDDDSDVGRSYDNKLKRQKLTEDTTTSSDDTNNKMSDSTSNTAVSTGTATTAASTSNSSVSYTSGRTSDVDATDTKEVSTDSMKVASTNKEYEDTEDSDTDFWLKERYDIEESCPYIPRYAICCLQCKCDTTKKDYYRRFVDPNGLLYMNNCGNSKQSLEQGFGNSYLYHKGCCHGFKATGEGFQSPMQEAIWNSTSQYNIDEYNRLKEAEAKPLSDLIQSLKTARKKQVMRDNLEDDTPDALKHEGKTLEMYLLETSVDFRKVKADFQKRMDEKSMDHPLVVFDLFSGIGSAAVVLKKLQLPIKTMLHVEHDPVAVYVSQFNHKDDGIQHVYIETFESVYGYGDENSCDKECLRKWIEKYGPIDLVVAGAPCQNYSEVNAFCDREKQNAKYLLQVGTLITMINEIQEQEKPVLFMSENVVFRNYDDIMKKYSDVTSIGLPPVKIDAQDFSPMVRNRYYWTNMPPDTLEDIDAKYRATPNELLDEGWSMAARAYSSWEEAECLTLKANTSMASKGRIDDMRMTKIKETEVGRFIKRR